MILFIKAMPREMGELGLGVVSRVMIRVRYSYLPLNCNEIIAG